MADAADETDPSGEGGGTGDGDRETSDEGAGVDALGRSGSAVGAGGDGPGAVGPGGGDPALGAGGEGPGGESPGGGGPADAPEDHGAYAHATPEQLLAEARTARREARRARHAYWFPLVLFGLLSGASIPFYIQQFSTRPGVHEIHGFGRSFWRSIYLGGDSPRGNGHAAYYWLVAILVGLAATAAWYRLRGDRVGLRTPSRGYVITGLVLLVLALFIPVLATRAGLGPLSILMPGDLLIRGTFPLVLIGIGLCFLAWAERSVALSLIAAGYLAWSLVASLYDIENLFYRLGWNISPDNSGLPNVVLPALVLLLSGAGAWVVQRRRGSRSASPPQAGQAVATGQPS
jgi:hypothetical protein